MARFNVFEGSRRVALLLKVLWAIGALAVGWTASPSVYWTFATSYPDAPFIKDNDCTVGTGAVEFINRPLGADKSISIGLCFRALQAESGAQVVPYKVEKGRWWGNTRYAPDVEAYIETRANSFQLSQADQSTAREEWNRQWLRNIRNGVLVAFGGWIVLSVLQVLIGWIVRGFCGIPWGRDRRAEPTMPVSDVNCQ